ncbi:MAG: HAD family hydrolase [Proteobacteria bacterium]|nr:MAG: HAD family hydrolase [Pseudomonadota bacterium]
MQISCSGVLLDLDGVLVDSTPAVERVWTGWALEHGLDPKGTIQRAHGRPSLATIRELLPDGDHLAEDREVERREIEDVEGVVPLPGAVELVTALPEGRWAVVTSGTRPLATVRLKAAGLRIPRHFVTATDIRNGKPDPEPYLLGARSLGLPAADCVAIEDAPAGVRAGKAAGSRVIAVRTTTSEEELRLAGADWIVNDLASLAVEQADSNAGLVLRLSR